MSIAYLFAVQFEVETATKRCDNPDIGTPSANVFLLAFVLWNTGKVLKHQFLL